MPHRLWLLVDFSNLAMRAYHKTPEQDPHRLHLVPSLVRKMLQRLVETWSPTHLLVARDCSDPCFRYELAALEGIKYKGTRSREGMTPAKVTEFLAPYLEEWGVVGTQVPTYEGDDVLAGYVRQITRLTSDEVLLVSKDRDIFQLVNSPQVNLLWPGGEQREEMIDTDQVIRRMGVLPRLVPDLKALAGDDSDNLPRVGAKSPTGKRLMGFTPARAAEVVSQYGGLVGVYGSLHLLPKKEAYWLKICQEQAFTVKRLATLNRYCLTSFPDPDSCAVGRAALPVRRAGPLIRRAIPEV